MQLKVTCDTSASSVEFLDIVIHKGTRWLTEGRFDLYTYQKKLNLYGYMPYRSAHPIHRKSDLSRENYYDSRNQYGRR